MPDARAPTHEDRWKKEGTGVSLLRDLKPPRPVRFAAEPEPVVVDMARAALIVIDMQNDLLDPDGWFATARGVDVSPLSEVIGDVNALGHAFRAVGAPVLHVNWAVRPDVANLPANELDKGSSCGARPGYGDLIASGRVLVRDEWGAQSIAAIDTAPTDILVGKHRLTGFRDNEVDQILRRFGVDTLFFTGVTGVQWSSDALLSAIAERSAQTGRRIHMHLLETEPQRQWADAAYPEGIVARLAEIGLLSPRLTLAHCVWARPEELDLLARHGARIAVNTSSNLHLYSGLAPVPGMLEAGVEVAMGLDDCAFDEDDDGLRELRLFHLVNHAPGFRDDAMTPARALRAACRTGRAALGLGDGGVLAPGMPVDPRDLLFARATSAHIAEIWAAGRRVLAEGAATGVDLPALEEALRRDYRAALPATQALRAAWPAIAAEIADHYRGCC